MQLSIPNYIKTNYTEITNCLLIDVLMHKVGGPERHKHSGIVWKGKKKKKKGRISCICHDSVCYLNKLLSSNSFHSNQTQKQVAESAPRENLSPPVYLTYLHGPITAV